MMLSLPFFLPHFTPTTLKKNLSWKCDKREYNTVYSLLTFGTIQSLFLLILVEDYKIRSRRLTREAKMFCIGVNFKVFWEQ